MRSLFLLAFTLATTSAFAFPKVGDEAKFTVTKVGGSVNLAGTFEKVILSTDGANFVVQTTLTWGGLSPQVSQKTVAQADLVSDAQLNELITNCSKYGAAGAMVLDEKNLSTCLIPATDDDGNVIAGASYNVAMVPFGLVNEIMPDADDGTVITLSLQSYIVGQ